MEFATNFRAVKFKVTHNWSTGSPITCPRVIGQGPQYLKNMKKLGFWSMGKQKQWE